METKRLRYSDDNREEILAFLESGGSDTVIELTDKQKELLDRWKFADEKIREQKYKRYQIAEFIMAAKNVSRDTAMRDIVNAEYVFSSSFPLNKKYLIGQRIEFLQKKINDAYTDNDRLNAALLEKQLCKYIEMYPEFKAPQSPKTIIYKFQQNNFINNQTVADADAKAETVIKRLEANEDF